MLGLLTPHDTAYIQALVAKSTESVISSVFNVSDKKRRIGINCLGNGSGYSKMTRNAQKHSKASGVRFLELQAWAAENSARVLMRATFQNCKRKNGQPSAITFNCFALVFQFSKHFLSNFYCRAGPGVGQRDGGDTKK